VPPFDKHIFICCNRREPGHVRGCCDPTGSEALQKAFFDVALGKTAPAAATQAPAQPAPTRAAAPAQGAAQTPADAPSRLPRPGSILDIRV